MKHTRGSRTQRKFMKMHFRKTGQVWVEPECCKLYKYGPHKTLPNKEQS